MGDETTTAVNGQGTMIEIMGQLMDHPDSRMAAQNWVIYGGRYLRGGGLARHTANLVRV